MNAPDLSRAVWRKSSRSNGNVNCVEVASVPEAVAVRDSKNDSGPVLIFPGRRLGKLPARPELN